MNTKSIKINKNTTSIVFQADGKVCNLDRYELTALSLLTGFYNPLTQFSKSENPIDLDKLKELTEKYKDLINETIKLIDVDVEDIEFLKK